VAFSPDGRRAWITAEIGGIVSIVDVATNKVTGTLKIDRPGAKPKGVVAHPNGRWVYVANGASNDITVIDAEQQKIAGYVAVGRRPWGLALSPDGGKLYVANGVSDTVSVIDTATQKVVSTVKVGKGPWGVAISR
jgi:YVTN family beta-propeller protein